MSDELACARAIALSATFTVVGRRRSSARGRELQSDCLWRRFLVQTF
jgi:hypothetical protein